MPRVVVITGGSSGLGRATARLFARHGWHVGLIARGLSGLAAVRADIAGTSAATAAADVADAGALAAAAGQLAGSLGPPDVWINCAGSGVYGRFADVPQIEFQRVTDVNYHGTVNGTRIALDLMAPRGRGTIVNVCSSVAFHGLPMMSSYAGAKAAVRAFSQAVRLELAIDRSRIRVSTVFPPAINTPFFSHAISHMGWPARPAPPVYQPEVIARGIMLAARSGRPEVTVTGTSAAFSLTTRLLPWIVPALLRRLGTEGQLTRDPAARVLEEPAVFTPSQQVFDVRGPFTARERSLHLWLSQNRTALLGLALSGWAVRRATRR